MRYKGGRKSKWTNWEKGLTSFNPINLFQMLVVEEEEEEEVEGEEGEGEGEEDDEGGDAWFLLKNLLRHPKINVAA